MKSTIHYLVDTNGPQAVSYYDSNFAALKRNVRLSGYPHAALRELISQVCRRAEEENTPVELIHHCLDNSLQGIILPELSGGIFGFDAYDRNEPNILAALDGEDLRAVQENIAAARKTFSQARAFHNEQEKIYGINMDFSAANQVTERTVHLLLDGKSTGKPGSEVHRFFGAATADGNLDYVPEVTVDVPSRYFVKGRPGTGKSTFLKVIATEAKQRGFHVERYHCSLDPNSLDMVAVRELGFCLLDSTAPHEYFPSRAGDEIIDFYGECVTPGTDEKYESELLELKKSYKELVAKALVHLKEAKKASDVFEAALPPLNANQLEDVKGMILEKLF